MQTKQQLESALVNADRAGDTEAAKILANALKRGEYGQPEAIPADDPLLTGPLSLIPGQDAPAVEQEPTTLREDIIGAGETALALGTGATGGTVGMMGGFLSGLAQEIRKGNFGSADAADRIEQAAMEGAAALTRAPRTRAGQQQVQVIGEVAQQAAPLAGLAGEIKALASTVAAGGKLRPGQRLIDDNGQPTPVFRKGLDKEGIVFENLAPEVQAMVPRVAGKGLLKSQVKGPVEEAIIGQLKANASDNALAELRLVGGRIAPNPHASAAIKQGFEPGFVRSVDVSNKATREGMGKILTIMERIQGNDRLALDLRPTHVTGDSLKKRLVFLKDKANKGRIELGRLARTELHGKEMETTRVTDALSNALDELGIGLMETEKGKQVPVFTKSIIKKNSPARKAVKDTVDLVLDDLVGGDQAPDAFAFHQMKRQFDDLIDFKKQPGKALSEKGRNVLKTVRSALNDSIREVSTPYAEVNDIMHKSLTALDDFQSAVGSKLEMFKESGGGAIGQEARKIMSNYRAKTPIDDAITLVDNTVSELGGSFPDDVRQLALFARGIEDRFGTVNKTSLQGEVGTAIKQTGQQGFKGAATDAVIGKAAEGVEALRGINDFNAFKAMRELINRQE